MTKVHIPPKILLVDDRQENLEILKLILKQEGYNTNEVDNGKEVLSVVLDDAPDLIMLDILMPDIDGYEVCRILKENPQTADIPVIFLSALGDTASRVRALQAGGIDYIPKPFSIQEVVARVRIHLSLRYQQQEIERLHKLDKERIEQLSCEIEERQKKENELQVTSSQLHVINQIISTNQILNHPDEVLLECCRTLLSGLDLSFSIAITPVGISECEDTQWRPHTVVATQKPTPELVITPTVQAQLVDLCRNMMPIITDEDVLGFGARSLLWVPVFSRNLPLIILVLGHTKPHAFLGQEQFGWRVGQAVYQVYDNSYLHEQHQIHTNQLNTLVEERTRQLEQTSSRMAAILASISDGIVLLNGEGLIVNTNTGFDRLVGIYPDEYYGRSITDLIEPDHVAAVRECIQQVKIGKRQCTLQAIIHHKSGKLIDVDISVSTVRQNYDMYVVNIHDISLLKELERIKSNFISMVTHELRTPITGILLIARQLDRYYDRMTEEQRIQKVGDLMSQGQALAELVESVLDISRLEAREKKIPTGQVDIVPIAERVFAQLETTAEQKQQAIEFHPDNLPILVGDPADFTIIFRNLVSNAIKYTPANGEIHFCLGTLLVEQQKPGAWSHCLNEQDLPDIVMRDDRLFVAIQVADNGHGISDEDLPNLFTQFDRGWASNSNIQGTGLGLPLVKKTVERYNGHVIVESKVGVGTTFTVLLPA